MSFDVIFYGCIGMVLSPNALAMHLWPCLAGATESRDQHRPRDHCGSGKEFAYFTCHWHYNTNISILNTSLHDSHISAADNSESELIHTGSVQHDADTVYVLPGMHYSGM